MTTLERASAAEPDVAAVIAAHFELMRRQSPPESCHVLPASALQTEDTHLFVVRDAGSAVAVGALRVEADWGELKSMHTLAACRGRGLARFVLEGLTEAARGLELRRLYLETGSGQEHEAARSLYAKAGFVPCPPFGSYVQDPLSLFMVRDL